MSMPLNAGNHALGLAYHGQQLGIPVKVVMPIVAPITKVQNCRDLQADVYIHGAHILESKVKAMELAEEHGLEYINGFDHPAIIAGQGSVGIELLEQVRASFTLPCHHSFSQLVLFFILFTLV